MAEPGDPVMGALLRTCAPAEIVDGSCGILAPAGDAIALATALRALIRDPALRCRLGASGPTRASMLCDPAQQLAKLHSALEAAIRETPHR